MKSRMLRLFSISAIAMVLGLGLTACNTIEGVGEDTAAAGEAIEDTARDASN